MSRLIKPLSNANQGLLDPRSTGLAPPVRGKDILALKGTLKERS